MEKQNEKMNFNEKQVVALAIGNIVTSLELLKEVVSCNRHDLKIGSAGYLILNSITSIEIPLVRLISGLTSIQDNGVINQIMVNYAKSMIEIWDMSANTSGVKQTLKQLEDELIDISAKERPREISRDKEN